MTLIHFCREGPLSTPDFYPYNARRMLLNLTFGELFTRIKTSVGVTASSGTLTNPALVSKGWSASVRFLRGAKTLPAHRASFSS